MSVLHQRNYISAIAGTGSAVPSKVLTNHDLEKIVDTTDEWITSRTGIKERHVVEDDVMTSDIATEAALKALDDARVKPEELDMIVLGTVSGDVDFPATACYVQAKIRANNAAAFDLSAACSGFLYGINVANGMIKSNNFQNVLVIGCESLSRIVDWEDRTTCVLFGDGAGAAVLQPAREDKGVFYTYMKSDGNLAHLLYAEGTRFCTNGKANEDLNFIRMGGRETFKHAVTCMGDASTRALEATGLTGEDLDLMIPHQANIRIIDATAKRIKVPKEKVYINLDRFGNTSAASIPIALDEARRNGRLKDGDLCLLVAFGGGFTWGSVLVQF